ncbi:hypothetical protein AVEN_88482-1, partial [Araneus ventricosus]
SQDAPPPLAGNGCGTPLQFPDAVVATILHLPHVHFRQAAGKAPKQAGPAAGPRIDLGQPQMKEILSFVHLNIMSRHPSEASQVAGAYRSRIRPLCHPIGQQQRQPVGTKRRLLLFDSLFVSQLAC